MTTPNDPPEQIVRPKASQRKGRTGTVDHTARRPSQKRSIERFNAILKATERLLQTARIEDISFHDIARQANLPPPSVHYLFPTMSAVRIELSRLYNQQASEVVLRMNEALRADPKATWQDWMRRMALDTRDHYNANRHMCEVLLGPILHRESRLSNMEANDTVATALLENLRTVFVVPEIPNLANYFVCLCEIVDALWSRSYMRHGRVDDASLEESVAVQIAYLRSIFPEILPRRDELPTPKSDDGDATTSAPLIA